MGKMNVSRSDRLGAGETRGTGDRLHAGQRFDIFLKTLLYFVRISRAGDRGCIVSPLPSGAGGRDLSRKGAAEESPGFAGQDAG